MSGNNTVLFLKSLHGLRNTLAAAVDQIDVLLDLAERPAQEQVTVEVCQHPVAARADRAVMGHPRRFLCQKCNQLIEE